MRAYISIILFSLCFSTMAQQNPGRKNPDWGYKSKDKINQKDKLTAEQQATLHSKQMTLDLDLNKNQEQQIYSLILNKMVRQKKLKKNKQKIPSTQSEKYEMKLEFLEEQILMKKTMKSILSEKQYNQWVKISNKKRNSKKPHKKVGRRNKIRR